MSEGYFDKRNSKNIEKIREICAELPEFIMPMVEDVMDWCLTGFEKVGKIGLLTAVILILVGILLLVLRKNKTEAEPYSGVEMQ